ncbi:MAG: (d)CMP kinase [Fimbriimonadales bacterium]|jgi:cytidylate kinase|nr:(d)CMP kinase [Armatimonadota bacterium]MCX7687181.1 (d)CMP kinase [Fimbriimonadales bacterium]CUU03717.1 cytidylate kinase [Armatimonadetes bacterium GBS]CUU36388.1 cytidylate kinase [Armatimonadetes bacterium DC]CUU36414.1 cytidylate kinase [Armatimonadetes bacterium GXS]
MIVIAIDGPAGSGKSTLAKNLAQALGFVYLDTGAMYRALALKAQRLGIRPDDAERLAQLAESLAVEFRRDASGEQRVYLDGEDVSEAIRTPEVSNLASQISVHKGVRQAMVARQRAIGAQVSGLVAEGRDTTTVVFPNATLKIFLTASPEERARRRQHQLQMQGIEVPYEQVLQEILERDQRDSTRAESPLTEAPDAVRIVNDGWTKEQTLAYALQICRERLGLPAEAPHG